MGTGTERKNQPIGIWLLLERWRSRFPARTLVRGLVSGSWLGLNYGLAEELAWLSWCRGTRMGTQLPAYSSLGLENVGGRTYSRQALAKYSPLPRTRWLMLAAAAFKASSPPGLLIIGPRFESEIFLARGLGWRRGEVKAIDLLTSSRRVTRGDMHQMPFGDDAFGTVVCGWTLSYSKDPKRAAAEIGRVLAPGGVVLFGVEVAEPGTVTDLDIPLGADRVQSVGQIRELFPDFSNEFTTVIDRNLLCVLRRPAD
jgi:SAM-dependent methyltransferase